MDHWLLWAALLSRVPETAMRCWLDAAGEEPARQGNGHGMDNQVPSEGSNRPPADISIASNNRASRRSTLCHWSWNRYVGCVRLCP